MEFLTNPAWIAVIGSILGGLALRSAEKWLNRNNENRAERQDYRLEIKELQDRLDKVEAEVASWRSKYYESQDQILRLKAAMFDAGIKPPE